MGTRIAVLGSGTARTELPPHLTATTDAEPWLAPVRLAAFARTPYERLIADVGYVDAAQRAAPTSHAVFINSFADYGIDAMRAVLTIPVIGAGEATLRAAVKLAPRFAIVTVWPESMRFLYDERLRALGIEEHCAAIEHVSNETELTRLGSSDGVMERMHRREGDIVARLREACRAAIAREGVGAIVLGCTCMAPIGPALAEGCPVPVLESSRIGYAAAVSVARNASCTIAPATTNQTITALVDGWAGVGAPSAPAADNDCSVCVTLPGEDRP